MAKQIIIPSYKQGGTLSQIAQQYNTSVDELMKLNPNITDPNKIIAGNTLNVPDMTGTLNKPTTPTGNNIPYTQVPQQERVLPDNQAQDNLSKFKNLMNQIVAKNAEARKQDTLGKFQDMGLDPNKVSGGTLADIMGYVKKYSTEGIEDRYSQALETIDTMAQKSQDTIQQLIDAEALSSVDDKTLSKLATNADIDYELLLSLRDAEKAKANKPVSFQTVTKDGKKVRIGFDENGKIISETPTGADITKEDTNLSLENLPEEDIVNIKQLQYDIQEGNLDYREVIADAPYYAKYLEPMQY